MIHYRWAVIKITYSEIGITKRAEPNKRFTVRKIVPADQEGRRNKKQATRKNVEVAALLELLLP